MSTTYGAAAREPTPALARRICSFLTRGWSAFRQQRIKVRVRATLSDLSDRELMDIGITRGEVDYVALNGAIEPPGAQSSCGGVLAVLCTACTLLFASEARTQCSARDVLQNHLTLKKTPSPGDHPTLVKSADDVPVWKTITVGTFANSFTLGSALDAKGCGVGDSAGEILARPTFSLSTTRSNVELFAVSAAELGFLTDTASLADIYGRAQEVGFELASAEVGPQLRLQYLDQPIGEFLILGMHPIRTWKGEFVILTVADGGAGLILIGQDGSADAQIPVQSRFLFVRSNRAAPAGRFDQPAALVPP